MCLLVTSSCFTSMRFDLRSELAEMRARLYLEVNQAGLHSLWDIGAEGQPKHPLTVMRLNSFVMKCQRRMYGDLENLNGFLHQSPDNSELNSVEVAKRVIELKPHISFGEARVAVSEVAGLRDKLSKAGVLQ